MLHIPDERACCLCRHAGFGSKAAIEKPAWLQERAFCHFPQPCRLVDEVSVGLAAISPSLLPGSTLLPGCFRL